MKAHEEFLRDMEFWGVVWRVYLVCIGRAWEGRGMGERERQGQREKGKRREKEGGRGCLFSRRWTDRGKRTV